MKKLKLKVRSAGADHTPLSPAPVEEPIVTAPQNINLSEVLTKWSTKYKATTAHKMEEQLHRISQNVFGANQLNLDPYLQDYKKILDFLKKQKPTIAKVLCNTIRQLLISCNQIKTPAYQAYYQYYGNLSKQIKKQPYITVKEEDFPHFRWSDFGKVWNRLHHDFISKDQIKSSDFQVYLVFSLYYLIPPLRPQDWLNSKIVHLDPNADPAEYARNHGNIIDLIHHQIVIADYKTLSTHGVRVIPFDIINAELGQILTNIIEKLLRLKPTTEYLLTTKSGHPIAEQNIIKIFGKAEICGKKTNPKQLRNLFISEKIIDANLPLEHRQRLAYIMGHTIQTQGFTYSKYSHCLHPELSVLNADDLSSSKIVSDKIDEPSVKKQLRLKSKITPKHETDIVIDRVVDTKVDEPTPTASSASAASSASTTAQPQHKSTELSDLPKNVQEDIAKCIQDVINQYFQKTNDVYLVFIDECIEKDPTSLIKVFEVYEVFKNWWHSTYGGRPPDQKEMKDSLEKKLGKYPPSKGGWRGYHLVNPV